MTTSTTATPAPKRLLISAFGIHTGGGLVLLRALLCAVADRSAVLLLDCRLVNESLPERASVTYVKRSFVARARELVGLARAASEGDVLLCFNGLPPPLRSRAHVVTYVQAPHFVGMDQGIRYAPLTSVRHFVESNWFRLAARYSDEIWVQTPSMASSVLGRFPAARVAVVPLIDDRLALMLQTLGRAAADRSMPRQRQGIDPRLSLFYPADAVGHKNHLTLLQAWRLLADSGHHPRLELTLRAEEWTRLTRQLGFNAADLPNVINLGRMQRDDVLHHMTTVTALIFPSRAETFGLPMLEARALGVPILAAERDFVRDVCVPAQSFDPASARSIADAVVRFTDGAEPIAAEYWSGARFVQRLLS